MIPSWSQEFLSAHRANVSRALIERDAFVLVTAATNYREIASRWVRALLEAYDGRASVAEALGAAAVDIDALAGA